MAATSAVPVGVVGAGLMGSGIVEVCARSGCDVVSYEVDRNASAAGRARVEASLDRALSRGRIDTETRSAIFDRIRFTVDLADLVDRQFVFEAVVEDEGVKLDLFRRLDHLVGDSDVILATNTSSIPVMKLAMATRTPERVIGVHFFNPAPVQRLVELVPSLLTSDDTFGRARDFATDVLAKTVIRSQDRAGFIVNSLLVPYLLSAIRMFDSGFASAEDIDRGMELGCAHPMGPLRLADLIGLDTLGAIAEAMYEEFKEQLYFAPPVLLRMVEAGLLGRKAGRGFYEYA